MATSKAPLLLPTKGDIAFVQYYQEPKEDTNIMALAKGSPFKSKVVGVVYKQEAILYTVRHMTDSFEHTAHISDFIAMGDGDYARMKKIRKADDAAHKAWLKIQA